MTLSTHHVLLPPRLRHVIFIEHVGAVTPVTLGHTHALVGLVEAEHAREEGGEWRHDALVSDVQLELGRLR